MKGRFNVTYSYLGQPRYHVHNGRDHTVNKQLENAYYEVADRVLRYFKYRTWRLSIQHGR
jgi:hypothetical protein